VGVPVDVDALERALPAAVAGARSLEEIAAWLESRPGVKAVRLADYLSKSHPPQRDFIVQFETGGDATVQKVVNVFDLGNQQFTFNKLRDR
jgi:hypothetical protein